MPTVITGVGCYIPPIRKTNKDFEVNAFFDERSQRIITPSEEVTRKFHEITGIEERRYAETGMHTSDMGYEAALQAIQDAGIDPETLDQVIVAHNYGDVMVNTIQTDTVPSLAARIKHRLGIRNPNCVGYDLLFGCPGWLQGVIHTDAFFKAGVATRTLVIGTEALSRVLDVYDRDSMIFSDGAGACVFEAKVDGIAGILGTASQTYSMDEAFYINMGKSYIPQSDPNVRYIKMKGRKVYEFALKNVPLAMKDCLDKSGVDISQLNKIFIHQANEKMDEAIVKAFYKLYNIIDVPKDIMPMSIQHLGNSSVATIPTLLYLVKNNQLGTHELNEGDVILFASVGAGMNINAVCYRM